MQLNAQAYQAVLENRADKVFVAQQYALDSRQVHVNQGIALVYVSRKQGNDLGLTLPRW